MSKKCIGCGKIIDRHNKRCMPCWRKYQRANMYVEKICQFCGKKLKIQKIFASKGYGKFCSRKCYRDAGRMKKACMICGRIFEGRKSKIQRQKLCSNKCRSIWYNNTVKRGENSPFWIPRETRKCIICGTEFKVSRNARGLRARKRKFCSVRCRNLYLNLRMPVKATSIELKIEHLLAGLKLNYEKQKMIKEGKTIVDFYIPAQRIVIYADGDYWHSKPEVQRRDATQDLLLGLHGYNVLRLKGTEVNNNISRCQTKIKKMILRSAVSG